MNLKDKHVVLTGAAGGIGSQLATLLAARGARLSLVDINREALNTLAQSLDAERCNVIAADLANADECQFIIEAALLRFGSIDVLLNSAGMLSFNNFASTPPEQIEKLLAINLTAPALLIHHALPVMLQRGCGSIVNVGSTFGSIGFACFSAYSASKYGLRGLSEALRRELDGSGVNVIYVAPRAVKTALNPQSVYAMGKATGMHMDEPAAVARQIVEAVEAERRDVYLGWPEALFVRINALLPRLVDRALKKQSRSARQFSTGSESA